jgi:hypothetical protein
MYVDHVPTRSVPQISGRERERESWCIRQEQADSVGRYVQVCRGAEAARLFLAELGRRHGPMA